MSEPVHLAIDLGASGGRVIAGKVENGRLSLETIHRFANGPVRMGESLLWDSVGLWQQILTGLTMAATQYANVASIGVDTWGVDYVLLDRDQRMLGQTYHYRDRRNDGMMEAAFRLVPRNEIFTATGLQFMQINSCYQLLSQSLSGSSALRDAESFLMMGDYFHWLLTGKRSIEITNASTTQLLDPTTGTWSLNLIERLGLPAKIFAPLVEPGTNLGSLQAWVADVTKLGPVPVIVPPTHDTASAVLAVPADDFAPAKPNWCYISSGTWSLMGCELPYPIVNQTVAKFNFTNERGLLGSTRLLKNIGGLWLFQQIRAAKIHRGETMSWEAMVQAAVDAPAHQLMLDPDDAAFAAPADMIAAIEQYADRTGQTRPASNGVLYRSALEGLALRYRVSLHSLETIVGNRIETIHIVGGGSLNALLCQMTADACQRTVVAGPVEATATGNVLSQMLGLGTLRDVVEARRLVKASFSPQVYFPSDSADWDEAAARFDAL